MNKAVADAAGAVLCVSPFMPTETSAAESVRRSTKQRAERARELYEYFVEQIRRLGLRCETGSRPT